MQKQFMVVSNARVGSTWLISMLGSLPDVYTDREFKWKPTYQPQPVHMVITGAEFSCQRALISISDSTPVVGSKMVLDPRPHNDDEYRGINSTLERDIRIIHLYRKYEEMIVSWMRYMGPLIKPGNEKHYSPAFRQAIEREEKINDQRRRLGVIAQMMSDSDREKAEKLLEKGDIWLPPDALHKILMALLVNDLWIGSLANHGNRHYTSIDYADINRDFWKLTHFIGSTASEEEIQKALAADYTRKVMTKKLSDIVVNYEEFHEICRSYDRARNTAIGQIYNRDIN